MTEIKIEKKKIVWPWILLLLGVTALLAYFFLFKNKTEQVAETAPVHALADVRENNDVVTAFVMFIRSDSNKMSLDHTFTNDALLKLTDATKAMANQVGFSIKADLDKAKEYADKITNDPMETTHADNIRKSADILSASLQNLQQAKYPGFATESNDVKLAAAAINPDILTLDQRDAVKNFFSKAADLLDKMN